MRVVRETGIETLIQLTKEDINDAIRTHILNTYFDFGVSGKVKYFDRFGEYKIKPDINSMYTGKYCDNLLVIVKRKNNNKNDGNKENKENKENDANKV